jgi:hypothetical protein
MWSTCGITTTRRCKKCRLTEVVIAAAVAAVVAAVVAAAVAAAQAAMVTQRLAVTQIFYPTCVTLLITASTDS